MDISSIHQKLALLDVDDLDDLQSSLREIDAALFNDRDETSKKSPSIEDTKSTECDDNSNDRNKLKEIEPPENNSSKKWLGKSKSFPLPPATSSLNDSADNDKKPQTAVGDASSNESMHQAFARSISLPSSVKLVSAMKGSRAQHLGLSPKLSVKWAPDVYDPPQTSLSHCVKNNKKQQKSKNRKNGKKGQKGSSSNSSSRGRDKRQARKAVSSSDRYQRSFDSHVSLVSTLNGTLNDFDGFDDGSSDSHCGSIFLKTSVTKLHHYVAEAL
ncbi:uncharacterized protein LOC111800500 [Cucurbita pepo subsp. pepo]|uniref:uncharacterized protein LOC111800500 n=1 Tax=Cucurbita pepo subsp. pepo TaxID=3664 RepID=UPI000C9D711E|nr:uncharacterized protein LOC111800500 [Cucurbita pepo subsp. pepo]